MYLYARTNVISRINLDLLVPESLITTYHDRCSGASEIFLWLDHSKNEEFLNDYFVQCGIFSLVIYRKKLTVFIFQV
jgi:hypothetical protein